MTNILVGGREKPHIDNNFITCYTHSNQDETISKKKKINCFSRSSGTLNKVSNEENSYNKMAKHNLTFVLIDGVNSALAILGAGIAANSNVE